MWLHTPAPGASFVLWKNTVQTPASFSDHSATLEAHCGESFDLISGVIAGTQFSKWLNLSELCIFHGLKAGVGMKWVHTHGELCTTFID